MRCIVKERINSAVKIICEDIDNNEKLDWVKLSEEDILFELILAVLGSQNKYEIALEFSKEIRKQNFLKIQYNKEEYESLVEKLEILLTTPLKINGAMVKYRFSKSRAKLIAYNLIHLGHDFNLKNILENSINIFEVRTLLIKNIKGFGPKQSSHFLRNIGYSNDIAVLDVHILRYMSIQGIISDANKSISSLKLYEKLESLLIDFLKFMKYPIGLIDQAIWIVMRVYQKEYVKWR